MKLFHRIGRPSLVFPLLILPVIVTMHFGCSSKEPVKIGFVGGLTGKIGDVGTYGRDGAILAVEARNASGGIRGRKVALEIRDDAQEAARVRSGVKELTDRGVLAIIGPIASEMCVAALPVAQERNVLLVSPSAMTDELSGKTDLFVRVLPAVKENSSRMADFMHDNMSVSTVAAVADLGNRAYTMNWVEGFKSRLVARGGRVTGVESYTSEPQALFIPLARRLAGHGAQAVLVSASAVDAAMICQQLRKIGWKGKIVVTEWASSEKFLSLGGSAVEGVVVSQFFDRESRDPRYLAFADAYRKRFGTDPGYFSVLGYDAANVVLDALETCNLCGGEALRDTILRIGAFQGIQEKFSIDAFGDAKRGSFIAVVRDGKYRVVR